MTDKPKRTLTLDDNTQASNPGGLRVNYLYWLRSFPSQALPLLVPLMFLLLLALLITGIFGWAFYSSILAGKSLHSLLFAIFGIVVMDVLLFSIGISLFLSPLIFLLVHTRESFLHGCVNAGVVVCTKPPLVAVSTDLTIGKVPQRVIKILPQPLKWIKNSKLQVGMRLATIALYEGNGQKGYWDDFHPVVVDCVTGNQKDIQRVLHSIPDWEWEDLDEGLKYIKTTKPGLYHVPFARCACCNQLVFLPLYWSHREQHAELQHDDCMTNGVINLQHQEAFNAAPKSYLHPHCSTSTAMPAEIIHSYLVNPFLYNESTFCCGCNDYVSQAELYWRETGQSLADYFQQLQYEYICTHGNPPPYPFM